MPYPPELVAPMREELTQLGFRELLTAEDVTSILPGSEGTVLLVINSVCGCAAGNARPAVAMALAETPTPDHLVTVFAGQDLEATEQARSYLHGYPPSSPAMALLRDGAVVMMLERRHIEGRSALEVAGDLRAAFDRYCAPQPR